MFRSFLGGGAFFLALDEEAPVSVFLKCHRPVMVAVEDGGVLVPDANTETPLIKGRGHGLPRPLMATQSWKRR
jgi:hypothetical protein